MSISSSADRAIQIIQKLALRTLPDIDFLGASVVVTGAVLNTHPVFSVLVVVVVLLEVLIFVLNVIVPLTHVLFLYLKLLILIDDDF